MIDSLLVIEFSRRANADIMVSTHSGSSDDSMVAQLFLGIFDGVKILQVLAVRTCSMTGESQLIFDWCEPCGRAPGISGTSFPDPDGVCSFCNSTFAFALSGSSRNGCMILLLSSSSAVLTVDVLGPWHG